MAHLDLSKIEKLVKDYYLLANELRGYTETYWQNMYRDIQGYAEALSIDDELIDADVLIKQVRIVKTLIEVHKNLNYTYGQQTINNF